jgi:hypothetical protein
VGVKPPLQISSVGLEMRCQYYCIRDMSRDGRENNTMVAASKKVAIDNPFLSLLIASKRNIVMAMISPKEIECIKKFTRQQKEISDKI